MIKRYFDKAMTIRNRREVTKDGYTYITYEDWFCDEWVGNFNVFDAKGNNLMHATLSEAFKTDEELTQFGDKCVANLKGRRVIK